MPGEGRMSTWRLDAVSYARRRPRAAGAPAYATRSLGPLRRTRVRFGGIKAALEWLATRRLPETGECVLISQEGWFDRNDRSEPLLCISPSNEHPGYFDVSSIDLTVDPPIGCHTRKPVSGESLRMPDGSYRAPVWEIAASFSMVCRQRDGISRSARETPASTPFSSWMKRKLLHEGERPSRSR